MKLVPPFHYISINVATIMVGYKNKTVQQWYMRMSSSIDEVIVLEDDSILQYGAVHVHRCFRRAVSNFYHGCSANL
jgi:hypothetical protein